MAMTQLTTHLLSSSPDAFKAATQHSFLSAAGTSSLEKDALLAWLTQDRIYALSYVPFIGALLSKCSLNAQHDRTSTLEWRLTDLLIDALTNIRREIGMFEELLQEHFDWGKGQTGEDRPREETRDYMDLFKHAARNERGLLAGMTLLWATEKCYLEAWKFAKSCAVHEAAADVVQKVLIPNWTSTEFEEFVDRIGLLVDELAARLEPDTRDREWKECENIWVKVVKAEERFWPSLKG